MAYERLREQIRGLDEDAFLAVCEEADARRGSSEVAKDGESPVGLLDPSERMAAAFAMLTPAEMLAGIKKGIARGDAAMIGRMMVFLEDEAARRQTGDLVVHLTDYRIKDCSLARIIRECDSDVYREVKSSVEERERRLEPRRKAAREAMRKRRSRESSVESEESGAEAEEEVGECAPATG